MGRKVCDRSSARSAIRTGAMATSSLPASTLDRSRMSLIRLSRSWPASRTDRANSTCLAVRFPSGLSASSLARIRRLLSGVRSSWLMLARNSDLYFDDRASCSARSSSSRRASSISAFFTSMARFWRASSSAFSSSSALVSWSSSWRFCSSAPRLWLCSSSSSVRMVAMIVLSTTPTVSTICSRKAWLTRREGPERRQLDDGQALLLEQHRQDDDVDRRALAQAGRDPQRRLADVGDEDRLALQGRLADEALADPVGGRHALAGPVAVAGHQLVGRLAGRRPASAM